jgi:phenylpyruvate tautomerase PptA (4-oxalocrotonate tautomerase family)
MPSIVIEIRRHAPRDDELALIEMVHAAMREAFRIPASERSVRLVVHEPHRFACPLDLAQPELYTHVTIDAFAGRSLDAKRALYAAIAHNLESIGIPADHVTVVLHEISRENWGVRGGLAACDVDLGFKIDV